MRPWLNVLFVVCIVFQYRPGRAEDSTNKAGDSEFASEHQSDAAAKRGYELLTKKQYLPPAFTQENMDEIWRAWPAPLRKMAENADLATRRKLIFERYGFTERVDSRLVFPTVPGSRCNM
jgi:hypothetical protein